jgi:uncharacterized protein YecE (DUF72 family)
MVLNAPTTTPPPQPAIRHAAFVSEGHDGGVLDIGTSGFDYPHWRDVFYPREVKAGDRLAFYARHFRTVELNVTFYRMPAEATFRKWAAAAPEGFTFALKASRYITHIKRLRDPRPSVEYLMERARLLGDHLGPILLQLPPDMKVDVDRLAAALECFGEQRVGVEFRDESWFSAEVEACLREYRAALCLTDRHGPTTPIWKTADWTYLRFHEGSDGHPCYDDDALRAWIGRVRSVWGPGLDGFAYFNNDALGCAVTDAVRFELLVAREVGAN